MKPEDIRPGGAFVGGIYMLKTADVAWLAFLSFNVGQCFVKLNGPEAGLFAVVGALNLIGAVLTVRSKRLRIVAVDIEGQR